MRQFKIISGTVNEIPDSIFELVDQFYDLLLSLTEPGYPRLIPKEMKGPEIVAALKGRLTPCQDKAQIRRLLEIINLCLFSPNYNLNA